ncbi:lipopolysaccharide biosynthesis protein [Autumnicola musiva]|uniref:Oligosaccharide flippase family protein n=1 Tax=Autumnicola musiva TaxID=3075589 RepID=A0ABU3D894_9FLAO|nr:oligosaccharide flippase family protein [Zunongwangia sp. F117]MDT0677676.1 oligosaccharide flippase family protein [Zunongwangia sp. F117]
MLKKIFSYGTVEGLAKGLNKITLLVLPFFLSTIDYGKVGLLVAIEMIIPLISLLGLERAVLRFYSQKIKFKNFSKTISKSVFWTHLFLLLLLVFFYLIGSRTFFGLNIFPDLILIIILIYFQGVNLITFNMLRVDEKHNQYFRGRLFFQFSKIILVLSFVYFLDNYLGYLIGSIIASIFTVVIFKEKAQEISRKNVFDKKTFSILFNFSWPFIFHGVASNLLGNADKFILERFMTLEEVGKYTLAYSIGSTMVFAFVGISVFLEPMIYKEENNRKRQLLLNKFLFLTLCSGLTAYIIISLSSQYILPLFYKNEYHLILKYIPLIAISYLIYPFYLKSNYNMIYEKKSLKIAFTSLFSASINIILNIIFIPIYGVYAAVFTTFISYILQSFIFILISNNFKINSEFLEVTFFGIVLILCFFYNASIFSIISFMSIYLVFFYYFKLKKMKEYEV